MKKAIDLILFLLITATAASAGDDYAVRNPMSGKNGADWIVVAPKQFMPALQPLMDRRAADGLRVAAVDAERIQDAFTHAATGAERIRAFARYAYFQWKRPAPRFLLLAGDTVSSAGYAPGDLSIPTFLVNTAVAESPTATDNPYADMDGDDLPDVAVGRIPAGSVDELDIIIAKILEYETSPEPGPWRRRVSMFASEGHFGKTVDAMLEEMFKRLVRNNVSPNFDLNMTYASPAMPYFYIPDKFGDKVIDRFNGGSLFMVYIGHGQVNRFDSVYWQDEKYPIMGIGDVPLVDAGRQRPFVFIIACLTGNFDEPEDSIGEELFKSPTGPIGVFASSEISHPYTNAILSKDIAYYLLTERPATIGEATVNIKRALFEHIDPDRALIDKTAQLMLPKKDLDVQNRDHLFLYNYLGDPATRIAYAADDLSVNAPGDAAPGDTITVTVSLPESADADVLLTLECPPTEIIHPIEDITGLEGGALEQAIASNYANANNKVAVSQYAGAGSGTAEIEITIPDDLPDGEYYIKAYAYNGTPDAMGFAKIQITR